VYRGGDSKVTVSSYREGFVVDGGLLVKPRLKQFGRVFGQLQWCASFTRQARRADRPAVLRLDRWRNNLCVGRFKRPSPFMAVEAAWANHRRINQP